MCEMKIPKYGNLTLEIKRVVLIVVIEDLVADNEVDNIAVISTRNGIVAIFERVIKCIFPFAADKQIIAEI